MANQWVELIDKHMEHLQDGMHNSGKKKKKKNPNTQINSEELIHFVRSIMLNSNVKRYLTMVNECSSSEVQRKSVRL